MLAEPICDRKSEVVTMAVISILYSTPGDTNSINISIPTIFMRPLIKMLSRSGGVDTFERGLSKIDVETEVAQCKRVGDGDLRTQK
jgi:hypothetical protein